LISGKKIVHFYPKKKLAQSATKAPKVKNRFKKTRDWSGKPKRSFEG